MAMRSHSLPRLEGHPVDLQCALQALRGVVDPSLGEDMLDLGLVETLRVDADRIELLLRTTEGDCPLSDFAADAALRALQRVLPERDLFVRHDARHAWDAACMSAAARRRVGHLVGGPMGQVKRL